MFSAENYINNKVHQFCGGYWEEEEEEGFGVMSGTQVQAGYDSCSLGSADRLMAEEQSRTGSINEAAGSSSKDHVHQQADKEDEGWLQLSIGGYTNKKDQSDHQTSPIQTAPRPVELELLPSSTSSGSISQIFRPLAAAAAPPPPPPPPRPPVMNFSTAADHGALFFLQHPGTSTSTNFPNYHHQDQIINWAYRPFPINITPPSTSSSSSPSLIMGPAGSYFPRPFQVQTGASPSLDFRVIPPPRRPHSGIWFVLQASQNQAKEPFLPQISKSYLRIKDGRMTIRLVKKYLVNKLSLEDESEIEITCKGQELLPFLTLQHVRDNIWSQRDFVTLLPNSSSSATDHIMVLFYGRSTASN